MYNTKDKILNTCSSKLIILSSVILSPTSYPMYVLTTTKHELTLLSSPPLIFFLFTHSTISCSTLPYPCRNNGRLVGTVATDIGAFYRCVAKKTSLSDFSFPWLRYLMWCSSIKFNNFTFRKMNGC